MADVVVRSIGEFLQALELSRSKYSVEVRAAVSSTTMYRGHASSRWRLSPGLYRSAAFHQEQNLVRDALRIAPSEFVGLSDFQRLAKMQHFGLRTRLLDVTENPLVALYFACHAEAFEDGVVFIFTNLPTFVEDATLVSVAMRFVFSGSWNNFDVDNFLHSLALAHGNSWEDSRQYYESPGALLQTLQIPHVAVLPSHSNPRMTSQSGAFLLGGMRLAGTRNHDLGDGASRLFLDLQPIDFEEARIGLRSDPNEDTGELRFLIPAENKPEIVRQLDMLEINRWRLFPDPENQMHYLNQRYRA